MFLHWIPSLGQEIHFQFIPEANVLGIYYHIVILKNSYNYAALFEDELHTKLVIRII